MVVNERTGEILSLLEEKSPRSAAELAEALGVSIATIRRDFAELEKAGLITRYRGGAYLRHQGVGLEPTHKQREVKQRAEKEAIGQLASSLIKEGEVVVLDLGTTTLEVARALRKRRNITVFTGSLPIMNLLAGSELDLYFVGGQFKHRESCITGTVAQTFARSFYYDHFFMGVAGVSLDTGYTDFGIEEVELKKTFAQQSKRITVLADHSKFEQTYLAHLGPLEMAQTLVTDWQTDPEHLQALREHGVSVHVAQAAKTKAR